MAGEVAAFCSFEEMEDIQMTVEGLQVVVSKLLIRLETTETELQNVKKIVSGGTTKATERALTLNDAVRQKGFLKKTEARSLLKCHHSEALRAMQEAADMFQDLHVTKNTSNHWVLAVMK